MRIERAWESDAAAAASIHSEAATLAFRSIFPSASVAPTPGDLRPEWLKLISEPESVVLKAVTAERVVGVVAVRPDAAVPSGQLLAKLYVLPEAWGAGVGSALHAEALAVARQRAEALNLWVLEQNGKARAMYERRGWLLVPGLTLANDPPEILDVLYQIDLSPEQETG